MASTPEARLRQEIDRLLGFTGWVVHDRTAPHLGAVLGVIFWEHQLSTCQTCVDGSVRAPACQQIYTAAR